MEKTKGEYNHMQQRLFKSSVNDLDQFQSWDAFLSAMVNIFEGLEENYPDNTAQNRKKAIFNGIRRFLK